MLRNDSSHDYHVSYVTEKTFLKQAKLLHAEVYLQRNFITADQLDRNGHLSVDHDPYQNHADYFVVSHAVDGELTVVATARQIKVNGEAGHASFPTISKLKLYAQNKAMIERVDPADCVEISALAKKRGHSSFATLMLYRQMWHHSLREHHVLWLMACDEAVFTQLKDLFGDALTQIGPKAFYMGSWVVPAALEVNSTLRAISTTRSGLNPVKRALKRDLVNFFSRGLPGSDLTAAPTGHE